MGKQKYICPFCGCEGLEYYINETYEKCSSCGYEFGTGDGFCEKLFEKFDCEEETEGVCESAKGGWISDDIKWLL